MPDLRIEGTPCAHGKPYNYALSGHPAAETRRYYSCQEASCTAKWQVVADHREGVK